MDEQVINIGLLVQHGEETYHPGIRLFRHPAARAVKTVSKRMQVRLWLSAPNESRKRLLENPAAPRGIDVFILANPPASCRMSNHA